MNLFDSHCHLENEGFQNDLPEVMQRTETFHEMIGCGHMTNFS